MTKHERQRAIKQIISTNEVRTQEELCSALHKQGVRVTQATLSRDLAELSVSRVRSGTGMKYVIPQGGSTEALRHLTGFEILKIEANETLVIVRTISGHAHAVGAYLDTIENENILGTIAGDDTIIVIPSSQKKTKTVKDFIQQLLA